MKKLFAILVSLILINGCSDVVDGDNEALLIERDGLKYDTDGQKTYSGKAFRLFENGQKQHKGAYRDGEKEGGWVEWYENGQKKWEGNFKDGDLQGPTET